MIEIRGFEPREYQKSILETAKLKNTLVVVPTGLGKSLVFLMLAVNRLNNYPNSKVVLVSPTKPLANQLAEVFKKYTNIDDKSVVLLTGSLNPKERVKLWNSAKVITATPQTIDNDVNNKRIVLDDVSLLAIDEAHRSRSRYANTTLAKVYNENAEFPRILGLTASPGSDKDKIREICDNLFIEAVEIRTEEDDDVKEYIQKKEILWEEVELDPVIKDLHSKIKEVYLIKINDLKNFGLSKPIKVVNKKDLIQFQGYLRKEINKGNNAAYHGVSLVAQALKLDYMLELLETQSIKAFIRFISKLEGDKSRAARNILSNKELKDVFSNINLLSDKGLMHPKLDRLRILVKDEVIKGNKIIIFANYRDTVEDIVKELNKVEGVKAAKLVGQKEGFTQKEQLSVIGRFENNEYNCLISTQVGEEGLDIKGCNTAIFYDSVGSEKRNIQRRGRVGRVDAGKVIFLITKGTRDEAYRWVAYNKEKRMKKILYGMQKKLGEFNG